MCFFKGQGNMIRLWFENRAIRALHGEAAECWLYSIRRAQQNKGWKEGRKKTIFFFSLCVLLQSACAYAMKSIFCGNTPRPIESTNCSVFVNCFIRNAVSFSDPRRPSIGLTKSKKKTKQKDIWRRVPLNNELNSEHLPNNWPYSKLHQIPLWRGYYKNSGGAFVLHASVQRLNECNQLTDQLWAKPTHFIRFWWTRRCHLSLNNGPPPIYADIRRDCSITPEGPWLIFISVRAAMYDTHAECPTNNELVRAIIGRMHCLRSMQFYRFGSKTKRTNAFYFMVTRIWLDVKCCTVIKQNKTHFASTRSDSDVHLFCVLSAQQTWNRYRFNCVWRLNATLYTLWIFGKRQRQIREKMRGMSSTTNRKWTEARWCLVCANNFIIIYTWCCFLIYLFIYFCFINICFDADRYCFFSSAFVPLLSVQFDGII